MIGLLLLLLGLPSSSAQTSITITDIVSGGYHTCVTFSDGSFKCFGNNQYGQLGYGDTNNRGASANTLGNGLSFINVGNDNAVAISVSKVYLGGYHTCIKTSNAKGKCFGRNNYGQLGIESRLDKGDNAYEMGDNLPFDDFGNGIQLVDFSLGLFHSCVILSNPSGAKCFGSNIYGQLGYQDKFDRGDSVHQMSDKLPFINVSSTKTIKSIVSGSYHNCVAFTDNTCKCWGLNSYGQLGLGDTNDRGDDLNEMGDKLPSVNLGTNKLISSLSLGSYHTCGLLDDASIKCWGMNNYGQLGLGDTTNRGDTIDRVGDNLKPIAFGGKLKATMISVGDDHSCAYLSDKEARCWGMNAYGQLGIGNQFSLGDSKKESGKKLVPPELGVDTEIEKITSGANHNCVMFVDKTIKCWGFNLDGNLGLGDQVNRGISITQLGENLPFVVVYVPNSGNACNGLNKKKCKRNTACKWSAGACSTK